MSINQREIESSPASKGTPGSGDSTAAPKEAAVESVSPWILLARQYGILVFWLLILIGFSIASPAFLTKENILSIFEHTAIVAIFAVGEAVIIIAAALDLSIAPVATIAGIVAAKMLKADVPSPVAVAGGLAVGAVAGFINGFITVRMKISPLIATLGTFSALSGLGLILTDGLAIFGVEGLSWLGQSEVGGVAVSTWVMLGLVGVLAVGMSSTVWGVRLLAIGGNAEAARRAGVRVDRYLWGAFIICGLCAALAGLVTFGTLNTAEPTTSNEVIFDAITAVALAGVLLTGGRGSILKVLIGALILGTIKNGLILLNVPSYYQLLTTGVLLIVAVWIEGTLDQVIERRRTMAATPQSPTSQESGS
jgi:ribose/xylose/arabinose/galactoside ABC-type transport system permease subunit